MSLIKLSIAGSPEPRYAHTMWARLKMYLLRAFSFETMLRFGSKSRRFDILHFQYLISSLLQVVLVNAQGINVEAFLLLLVSKSAKNSQHCCGDQDFHIVDVNGLGMASWSPRIADSIVMQLLIKRYRDETTSWDRVFVLTWREDEKTYLPKHWVERLPQCRASVHGNFGKSASDGGPSQTARG
jgi:hypothetical protein